MASFATEVLELISALQGLRVSGYVDSGSFALLAYDYLLTFEDEGTLIWPGNWTTPKILFIVARYLPFVDLSITAFHHFRPHLSPETCMVAYQGAGWLINIGILVSERKPHNLGDMGAYQIHHYHPYAVVRSKIIANLVVMGLFMTSIGFSALPNGLSGCLVTKGNTLIMGVWIVLMVYEAGIQLYRELGSSSLYLAVFRNGAIFYVYIFALSVANVIVISRLSRDQSTMLASLERVTHAILTQRLLLTLRKAVSESDTNEQTHLETIDFHAGPGATTVDTEAGFSRTSTYTYHKNT